MPINLQTWEEWARRQLKAELKRVGVGYAELALRLQQYGFIETEASIANKMKLGPFGEGFFYAVFAVVKGAYQVNLWRQNSRARLTQIWNRPNQPGPHRMGRALFEWLENTAYERSIYCDRFDLDQASGCRMGILCSRGRRSYGFQPPDKLRMI